MYKRSIIDERSERPLDVRKCKERDEWQKRIQALRECPEQSVHSVTTRMLEADRRHLIRDALKSVR